MKASLAVSGWPLELSKLQVGCIVSSPEPKAEQTAVEVAKQLDLQRTIHKDLHENDRTGFAYLPTLEFEQKILEFFNKPDEHIMGNETARQAQKRPDK
jgi:broad specificity phosphatase PhoE